MSKYPHGLTSTEVIRGLEFVTYRKLDYWVRSSVIESSLGSASGSGSRRLWSVKDRVCLETLNSVIVDMNKLTRSSTMGMDFVRILWNGLQKEDRVEVRYGSITLKIELDQERLSIPLDSLKESLYNHTTIEYQGVS